MLTPKQEQELREKIILARNPECKTIVEVMRTKLSNESKTLMGIADGFRLPIKFFLENSPIQLHDVLRDIIGQFSIHKAPKSKPNHIRLQMCIGGEGFDWNLGENLEGQTDETKQAIYNILIPTKK